jgi:hypothetical protein|tara:strand:- start:267 stop:494 length:228 start_codon:yes stop_codon:yes gene_type:complete
VDAGSSKALVPFKDGLTETTNPYKTSQTNRASIALYFQVETTEKSTRTLKREVCLNDVVVGDTTPPSGGRPIRRK